MYTKGFNVGNLFYWSSINYQRRRQTNVLTVFDMNQLAEILFLVYKAAHSCSNAIHIISCNRQVSVIIIHLRVTIESALW